jgi:glutamate 5-kinase
VTLTAEQMIQAEAAKRMLADEHFVRILSRIVEDAAEKAVFLEDEPAREANRQLVLAISRIRGELQADADAPEADKAADKLARAME